MTIPGSPRLTVAVPTCNGARHLREALTSIRSQAGPKFDLVVSDDRSDDDTLAIVRDVCGDGARVSVNSERLGLAGNWNRCVELGRTGWVAIFHQDDLMRPGHLAGVDHSIGEVGPSKIGLIAGPVAMVDDSGRPVGRSIVEPGGISHRDGPNFFGPGAWLDLVASENPFRCSAVVTRKEAHADVGGFDPSYRYAVDWDFWIRVARRWGLAWRSGPATVAMRWHPASETHRFAAGTLDLDEQVRLLDGLPAARNDRPKADRRLARAFLNRAHVALKAGNVILARECLGRSIRMAPGRVLSRVAVDPRLAVQMLALATVPGLAGRWFGRPDR